MLLKSSWSSSGATSADQRHYFGHLDSTFPLLTKSKNSLAIFGRCTVRFVSDQVGNPENKFSHDAALLQCVFMHRSNPLCVQ